MKYLLLVIVLLITFNCSWAQYTIQVKDQHSGEILRNIKITGIETFELSPNGLIHIDSAELISADSIVFYKQDFHSKVIYPPVRSDRILVYLAPSRYQLDEVIVKVNQSERSWRKATSSLEYLAADELLVHQEPVLNEQLNQLPGVFMQSGTNNTNRLTIRGIGSRTPYSSNRIKAYLNGFPLTNGNGVTVVEDIAPGIIESLEILKGPETALYGAGLGGVLKINTHKFSNDTGNVQLSAQTGSFNSRQLSFRGNYTRKNTGFQALVSQYSSKGFRENNEYKRNTVFLSGHHEMKNTSFDLLILYTNLFGEIPSSLDYNSYLSNPQQAAENWNNVEGYEEYDRLGINLEAKTTLGNQFRNYLSVGFNYLDPYEVRPFNILDEQSYLTFITDRLKYYSGNWEFILSGSLLYEDYNWATYEIENGNQAAIINKFNDQKLHLNAGLLATYSINNRWILEAGLNYSHTQYWLIDLLNQGVPTDNYQFDPVFSPSFGINYEVNSSANLYASVAHGFSVPSIEETLLPDGEVNQNLKPEEGVSAELGLRSKIKNLVWINATVYTMQVKNMLVTKRLAEDQFIGINAGEVNYSGAELTLRLKSVNLSESPQLSFSVTSSVSKSINTFIEFSDDGNDYSGNELPGIPSHVWHNKLSVSAFNAIDLNFSYLISGEQYITDDNKKTYNGHQVGNISISSLVFQRKKFSISAFAGIQNIFDTHYASMLLVNAPSFGGSQPRYYYPAEPRNGYIKVQLTF